MVLISEIMEDAQNEEAEKPKEEEGITAEQDDSEEHSEEKEEPIDGNDDEKPTEVNEIDIDNPAAPLPESSSAEGWSCAGPGLYNDYALRIAYIMRSYLHMQQTAAAGAPTAASAPALASTIAANPTMIAPPPKQSSSEESPYGDRCKVMMEVVRKEGGKWVVSKLILEHNHQVTPAKQHGGDVLPTPVMGMEFESVEAAKNFFYTFSQQNGFKPRTGSNRRSAGSGALIMQRFLCWRGNYLMYRKPSEANTRKRKRGPYRSRGGKLYEEFELKDDELAEVVEVDSSSEKAAPAGEDRVASEVDSTPPVKEAAPAVVDAGQMDSPPVIGTMLWGADAGKGKDTGKVTQVASTATSRLLRELGVRVYRYTNEERRDIILKYMMKRNNRQAPERPAKFPSRQALAERRKRGVGGKFVSKHEMQTSNRQGEVTTADSDSTTLDVSSMGGEPKVGIVFKNEDKAYEFYINYAGNVGFSVRKGWWDKTSRNVTRSRVYVCSREGFRPKNVVNDGKKPRPETRTGCPARMTIKITPSGNYEVTEFVPDHNHELSTPLDIQLLRSQKVSTKTEADGPQNAHLIPAEYKNYLRSKRMKDMRMGDGGALMDYLQKMKGDNPSFFYAIQVDVDDQLTNIFWSDANSQLDYYYFGDVVCFDSTYRLNDYGRPLALFLGVNHHKQILIFAAALIYDESVESFKWLFDTFKAAMAGRQPKTILTDRCPPMMDAVAAVWPGTVHRICAWHIYNDALEHLRDVFQVSETFAHDLGRCIYDMEDEEEFLSAWESMLEKYSLKDNEWLTKLYEDRDKWSPAYSRGTFSGDVGNVLRRESHSSLLKDFLNSERELLDFFDQFDKLVEERRYAERLADYHASQGNPRLPPLRLLWQASNAYTPAVFDDFRMEFDLFMNCTIYACGEVGTISEYEVTSKEKIRGFCVRFDSADAALTCSCKKFEFVGIPCCHALKVLDFRNIKELPPQYFLRRWRKDAKTGSVREDHGYAMDGDPKSSLPKRYSSLCRILYKIAARAAESLEAYSFLESQSDQLLEQVERILQTRLLEKPASGNASKNQPQNAAQNENDDTNEVQRLSGKKKKDGIVRRKNQNSSEMNKKQKGKQGQSDDMEITARGTEPLVGSNNIPSHPRNPGNQYFATSQFMQGPYVPSHQFGHGAIQGFHGMTQFSQETTSAALQPQPFHGQLSQASPAPDMNSLQFVGGTPQIDHQNSDQGHYAIPVWDFL